MTKATGRPRAAKIPRPVNVHLTLTEAEHDNLTRFAQANGTSMNAALRYLIVVAAQSIAVAVRDTNTAQGGR